MAEHEHDRFHTSRGTGKEGTRGHDVESPLPAEPGRRPRWQRYAHMWWRLSRGMTLGVRGVVFSPQRHVLLVRHTYTPGWQFPGGGVEPGETLREALARELDEEAGVRVEGEPALHGVFFNSFVSRRDHVAVYTVDRFRTGTLLSLPNREIEAVEFFSLDRLPRDTTPGTRRRLHEIESGLPPAPRW